MDRILIIGNGFDLYHGLPTRYTDFLFWVNHWDQFEKQVNKESTTEADEPEAWDIRLGDKNTLIEESIVDIAKNYKSYDADEFSKLSRIIKHNVWIGYFNEIIKKNDRWIDFENEISKVLKIIESVFDEFEDSHVGSWFPKYCSDAFWESVVKRFCNYGGEQRLPIEMINDIYASDIINSGIEDDVLHHLIESLNDLIYVLRFYLMNIVANFKTKVYSEQVRALGRIKVLSFNYTNLIRNIYGLHKVDESHHVHGSLEDNNMVLGVGDDVFDGLDFVYFQKYFQRIQKKTGNDYRGWVPSYEKTFDGYNSELYIFGHSLDPVDKSVLNYFIENKNITKIHIYYYNEKAYEELVINLIKLIDKEPAIEQVATGRIEFVKLEPAVMGDCCTRTEIKIID